MTVAYSSISTTGLRATLATKGVPSVVPTSMSPSLGAMDYSGGDLLLPVGIWAPPSNFESKTRHPVPRFGINGMIGLIRTNKFLCELLLGLRKDPTTLSCLTVSPRAREVEML